MVARTGRSSRKRTTSSGSRKRPAVRPDEPCTPELDLRRLPRQARGQATFEHVLDATARLLDEVGIDDVNTNAIARAAGVNIATLYQYFPNKQAILLALFQRQAGQRNATGRGHFSGIGSSTDWPERIDAVVDALAELRVDMPGTAALMQAMRADPELRAHHQTSMQRLAEELAEELRQSSSLSRSEAIVVARCAIEVNVALVDLWQIGSNRADDRILEQLKRLHRAFLGPYLPAPAATRFGARRRSREDDRERG
jgi:AcrR family transcriptional regulator